MVATKMSILSMISNDETYSMSPSKITMRKGKRRIRQPQRLVGLVPVVLQLLLEHLRLAMTNFHRANGVVRLLEPNGTVPNILTCV